MSLAPGTRLGPYEVITAIGAGGMGEVYRARDTKLRRDVALKILPDAFALDLERLARFEREAHVLASLNHPNIAHIYGLEDADGTHALVMELVEGPTLADRIARGSLPLDEALPIAKQIVDALEAAHEQGIIHRDLKPANVKVKEDGTVKVLDFGLAKALDPTPSADRADSPTVTSPAMTQQGVILGTAAYMSPEQARGKPVDRRADIWAFGVVLYEMLTGRRLFPGDTVTDILAAVLERQPDLNHVPAKTRPLFRRCLEKDPKRRLRDIGDALALLDEVPETVRVSRPWLAWGIAGLLAATLVPIALIHLGEDPPAPDMTRFAITLPENTHFTQDGVLSLSPDGRTLVFAATGSDGVSRLWLRALNTLEARPLTGNESADPPAPFWSPDSKTLAFYSGSKLRKLDLASGSLQEICDLGYQGFGGTWSLQGIILVGGGPSGGIMRVPAAGGVPVKVTTADSSRQELHHELPIFLPDGRSFLYFRHSTTPGNSGMYLGSLEATPEEQRGEPLLATEFSAAYVPSSERGTGQLLFLRGDTLFAQTFDARPKELTGDPVAVTSSLSLAVPSYGLFAASTGVLVYRAAAHQDRQLTWYDRRGVRLAALGEPGRYTNLAVSPDGTRVAVSQQNPTGGQDIYLIAVSSGTSTRLTSDPGSESQPVWSTDGSRIAFHLDRSGAEGFYQVPSTGGRTDLLLRLDRTATLTDWSKDGRLVYWQLAPTEHQHLWLLPVAGRREPIAFFSAPSRAIQGRLSPDGRWIAYLTNDSGGPEIFVQATHPPAEKAAAGEDRWIVSGGANAPIGWRNDSRELFYTALDGGIMAVQTIPDPVFQAMPPIKLFQVPVGTLPPVARPERVIDVTANGQRFLVAVPVASSARPEFTVVLNWEAALKR